MSRISNILLEVRDIVGDIDEIKYSDDTLIRLLNRGIVQINTAGNIIKAKSYIKIENNIASYNLSDIAQKIDRVQYLESNVQNLSYTELDKINTNWQNVTGDVVQYVSFDNNIPCKFIIYPKIINNVIDNIVSNSLYGGVIDITITDGSLEIPVNTIDSYGFKYLTVYYTKKPNKLDVNSADLEWELDTQYDIPLVYYISGEALRLNNDTLNRQVGVDQLTLFREYITVLKNKQSLQNNSVNYTEIPYKGFV